MASSSSVFYCRLCQCRFPAACVPEYQSDSTFSMTIFREVQKESWPDLELHIKMDHFNWLPYVCSVCGVQRATVGTMRDHMKMHGNDLCSWIYQDNEKMDAMLQTMLHRSISGAGSPPVTGSDSTTDATKVSAWSLSPQVGANNNYNMTNGNETQTCNSLLSSDQTKQEVCEPPDGEQQRPDSEYIQVDDQEAGPGRPGSVLVKEDPVAAANEEGATDTTAASNLLEHLTKIDNQVEKHGRIVKTRIMALAPLEKPIPRLRRRKTLNSSRTIDGDEQQLSQSFISNSSTSLAPLWKKSRRGRPIKPRVVFSLSPPPTPSSKSTSERNAAVPSTPLREKRDLNECEPDEGKKPSDSCEPKQLKVHQQSAGNERICLRCGLCLSKSATKLLHAFWHLAKEKGLKRFQCNMCTTRHVDRHDIRNHVRRVHRVLDIELVNQQYVDQLPTFADHARQMYKACWGRIPPVLLTLPPPVVDLL